MDKKTKAKKTIPDTICRVHRSGGYAVLSNCFVRSTNIGCDSIGLLGKINDLPPTWNFTIAGLVAICEDGETAIKSQLAELEQWGYVKKTLLMPNESPTGRISYLYDFYEYSKLDDSIPKYDIEMETFTADNATLNRVKKDSNFTIISAKLLRTNKIRNKLIGFMLKALSLPNSWNFSMSGLKAICKEGKTAVHNAVNKLIDKGYLVRTKLLSNESVNNHFEYVYSFFDVPVSKEEADELEAETRRKAITIREGGKAKAAVSSSGEKQKVENPYLDTPPAETPLSENQGQYNNNNTKQKNQLLCDKSSIISPAAKPTFNIPSVEKSAENVTEGYNAEEREIYTEIVKQNIDYIHLGDWLCQDGRDGYAEADEIVGFMVEEICSTAPYLWVNKAKVPRSVVKSRMLKANISMVENALLNMAQVDDIKKFQKYFITTLYNETLSYHFNEGCECRWAAQAVARDFGYAV